VPAEYAPAYAPPAAPGYGVVQETRPVPDRNGFTIGFGLGPGGLSIEDTDVDADTTVGISFRLGAAITPSFLLQADLEATRASFSDDSALQLNFFGVSATGYVANRVYLTGGLGVAELDVVDRHNETVAETDDELGVLLGIGVEAYQSQSFALSIELRGIGASFNDHAVSGANLLLGFQWF
jgi:hypothetical protein